MIIPCFIGYMEIVIILLIVLLLFGGKKIPELMRGMGRGIKEFRNAADEDNRKQSAKKQDK
ncbi:twin-arginine translocase TatA/TatE family subunit [Alistipes senegalensis]|uniref:Sec-independent protein translocase protein TatA n=1 Tax=Alistipes senegalensis JC50 TaxID=1033732 RepID=A0ABY5V9P6_9BACT|nr:twin-arginine translocase TatA/TatE family subunit [Alistipes senegalensis]UEA86433.1 twin-arginine translocase TatA/TatE family subunit [Alistipes senegalensis]UWN65978.1 twin-arginine translocase TatA/TatE family subunit [Alistipes senegalensis JC50]